MGGGLSATSHTTCIGPSNTYSGPGLDKKKSMCEGVFVCAHKRAWWLCVASYVCAVSGMGFSVDDERQ